MQSEDAQLDSSEILLRRVPPSTPQFQTIIPRGDGGFRATSAVMSTRKDEEHLSCSRIRLTSPRHLLEDLRTNGQNPFGWKICTFKVSDVIALGLEIAFTPTERDPGHCSISGPGGLAYPKNIVKKLARKTRILTDDDIDRPPVR